MPQLLSLVGKALGSILRGGSGADVGNRGRCSVDEKVQDWMSSCATDASESSSSGDAGSRSGATQAPSFSETLKKHDSLNSRPVAAHPISTSSGLAITSSTATRNASVDSTVAMATAHGSDASMPGSCSPPPVPQLFRASRASLSDTTASAAGEALRQASMTNRNANFTRDNLVSYMRWVRASRGAIKLARRSGSNRGPNPTLLLRCEHWLEVTDEQHRYGSNLRVYFDFWVAEMEAAELTPPPSPALMSPSPSHTHLVALAQQHQHSHPEQQPHLGMQHVDRASPSRYEALNKVLSQTPNAVNTQQPQQQQQSQPDHLSCAAALAAAPDEGPTTAAAAAAAAATLALQGGPGPSRFSSDATVLRSHGPLEQHPTHLNQPNHHHHQHPQQHHHHQQHRVKHKHLHWNYHIQHDQPRPRGQPGQNATPLLGAAVQADDAQNGPSHLHPATDAFLYEREGSVHRGATYDAAADSGGMHSAADASHDGGLLSPLGPDPDAVPQDLEASPAAALRGANDVCSDTLSMARTMQERLEQQRRRSCGEVPPPRHPAAAAPRPSSGALPLAAAVAAAAAGPLTLPHAVSSPVAFLSFPTSSQLASLAVSAPACPSPRRTSLCSPSKRFVLAALIDMSPADREDEPEESKPPPSPPAGAAATAQPRPGEAQQAPETSGQCGGQQRLHTPHPAAAGGEVGGGGSPFPAPALAPALAPAPQEGLLSRRLHASAAVGAACCNGPETLVVGPPAVAGIAPTANAGYGSVSMTTVSGAPDDCRAPGDCCATTPPPQLRQGPQQQHHSTPEQGVASAVLSTPPIACRTVDAGGGGAGAGPGCPDAHAPPPAASLTALRAAKLLSNRSSVGNGTSFFRWLDQGPGLQVDLVHLGVSRAKLDTERVKYLAPLELLEYELDVVMETGLLRYKRSGKLLHTGPDGRGSVDEFRRPPTPPPPAVPLSLLGEGAAAWWRGSAATTAAESAPVEGAAAQPAALSPHSNPQSGRWRGSAGGAGTGGLLPHQTSRSALKDLVTESSAVEKQQQQQQHGTAAAVASAAAAAPPTATATTTVASAASMPDLRGATAADAITSSALFSQASVSGCRAVGCDAGGISGSVGVSVLPELEVRGHSASSLNRVERSRAECCSPDGSGNGLPPRVGCISSSSGGEYGGAGGSGSGSGSIHPGSSADAATAPLATAAGAVAATSIASAAEESTTTAMAITAMVEAEAATLGTTPGEVALLDGQLEFSSAQRLLDVQLVGDGAGGSSLPAVAATAGPYTPSPTPAPTPPPAAPKTPPSALHNGGGGHLEEKVTKWIYVVDPDLRLFVHPKVRGRFHHSSFLCGGAVVAAGGLAAQHGRLRLLTADSGHYWPREENFRWLCEHLVSVGADLSTCELRSKHMPVPAATGRELMEKMGVPPPNWRLQYQRASSPTLVPLGLQLAQEGAVESRREDDGDADEEEEEESRQADIRLLAGLQQSREADVVVGV